MHQNKFEEQSQPRENLRQGVIRIVNVEDHAKSYCLLYEAVRWFDLHGFILEIGTSRWKWDVHGLIKSSLVWMESKLLIWRVPWKGEDLACNKCITGVRS